MNNQNTRKKTHTKSTNKTIIKKEHWRKKLHRQLYTIVLSLLIFCTLFSITRYMCAVCFFSSSSSSLTVIRTHAFDSCGLFRSIYSSTMLLLLQNLLIICKKEKNTNKWNKLVNCIEKPTRRIKNKNQIYGIKKDEKYNCWHLIVILNRIHFRNG